VLIASTFKADESAGQSYVKTREMGSGASVIVAITGDG
jgi:hypothetical protein